MTRSRYFTTRPEVNAELKIALHATVERDHTTFVLETAGGIFPFVVPNAVIQEFGRIVHEVNDYLIRRVPPTRVDAWQMVAAMIEERLDSAHDFPEDLVDELEKLQNEFEHPTLATI